MTSIYHTPITFGDPATTAGLNLRLGQLDQAIEDLRNGASNLRLLNLGASTNKRIVSGVITITGSHHTLTPETGTADDLVTINGGAAGYEITLRLQNSGDTITFKHNTGNIFLRSGADLIVRDQNTVVRLFYNPTTNKWTDVGASAGGYVLLERQVLTVAASQFLFSSISGDYEDLVLTVSARSDAAFNTDYLYIQFNGDTGGNYHGKTHQVQSTSNSYDHLANTTAIYLANALPALSASADRFSATEILIMGYARTDRQKRTHLREGTFYDNTAANFYHMYGVGLWKNTAAITSIRLFSTGGSNFVAGSLVSLWGKS